MPSTMSPESLHLGLIPPAEEAYFRIPSGLLTDVVEFNGVFDDAMGNEGRKLLPLPSLRRRWRLNRYTEEGVLIRSISRHITTEHGVVPHGGAIAIVSNPHSEHLHGEKHHFLPHGADNYRTGPPLPLQPNDYWALRDAIRILQTHPQLLILPK